MVLSGNGGRIRAVVIVDESLGSGLIWMWAVLYWDPWSISLLVRIGWVSIALVFVAEVGFKLWIRRLRRGGGAPPPSSGSIVCSEFAGEAVTKRNTSVITVSVVIKMMAPLWLGS